MNLRYATDVICIIITIYFQLAFFQFGTRWYDGRSVDVLTFLSTEIDISLIANEEN